MILPELPPLAGFGVNILASFAGLSPRSPQLFLGFGVQGLEIWV